MDIVSIVVLAVIVVAIGYLIVTAILTPFVVLIWYRRREEWHFPRPGKGPHTV
jgi:hypothetical protein